ncbi:unnamed protein product [Adineta ricciae]|uniref:Uncharacterized protein n=1 Tax=Adineta ricciae TaxID=249248 RepID=A0A815TRE4_ADIRI|nr:unnamed protein product [Adineta ricciae]
MANLIKSQMICLNNSLITCYCEDTQVSMTCVENSPSDNTFIDWSTFSSLFERQYYSFLFINFTRLTPFTFTNFSSTFPSRSELEFRFLNGIDEIEKNIFDPYDYFLNISIRIEFQSPRNFQLADNAFSGLKYREFLINNIQYNNIHNLPYNFNLKAFNQTNINKINIINSKGMKLISNQSPSLIWKEIQLQNCSLTNINPLIESLIPQFVTKLDLSSNNLIHLPSLIQFKNITNIDLQNNLIEEIQSNIFTNLTEYIYEINLSHNRIKHISHDAFLGMTLSVLSLENNQLCSLESLTINNELTSFLYPINQSLVALFLSHNFLDDFNPIKSLTNLNELDLSNNEIKNLDENSFPNTYNLHNIDLSSNCINSIHPLSFNRTGVRDLDLSSNLFSSLETIQIIYDEDSRSRNVTASFLDYMSTDFDKLSLTNCTNLIEINWFLFTRLKRLYYLDLSKIPKTDHFWFYQARDNTSTLPNNQSSRSEILLNNIQFNNDDYCLAKPIFHIFNPGFLFIDKDHPCNCFVFMFKNILREYPTCLSNQSIVDQLTQQCMNIDSYCLNLTSTTTTVATESTPLPLSSSTSAAVIKEDQKWKIILAIMIPSTIILIIGLFLATIYIVKRRKTNKSMEIVEMQGGFENKLTKR